VRAQHPELSQDNIDTVLHRMENHGFVLVKEKDGEKWYKLNAKWKRKKGG
jgi:DNA-binding PadR family transcriptional regulator